MRALDSICASFLRWLSGERKTVRDPATRVNFDGNPSCERRSPPSSPGCRSARHFAERLQLGLEEVLLPFEAAELDQQRLAFGPGSTRNLIAQAREIALHCLQLGFDRRAIEFIRRYGFVGEYGAALRRHLGDAADDEDAPSDPLALVNIDHPRPDRRNQRRVTRQHAEISFG